MTVYIDVLFTVNFIINSVLIYLTAMIMRYSIGILRNSISAAVAAIYSVIMFFPEIEFLYSGISKLLFSAVLIIITFKKFEIFGFLKTFLVFHLVSFIFCGAVFAIIFLTDSGRILGAVMSNGELYLNLNVWVLLGISVCTYMGILVFTKIFRRNYSRDRILKKLVIRAFDEEFEVTALIDTGCELCDPISEMPAMLIESDVLSDRICGIIGGIDESNPNAEAFERGVRYLPFSSIGCESGYIRGFIADNVCICDDKLCVPEKVTVGLAEFRLSADGLYNAIINPDLINEREEKTEYVKRIIGYIKG